MAERFPKTAAGVPNAQLDFERAKELKMHAFIADFREEYNSAGLPPADVCIITLWRLGAFLHLALFRAWSDAICDNEKPLIEFPVDCLVGRYALSVVYYFAGWTLYSASKASTFAADIRTHVMIERQRGRVCQHLLLREGNGGHQSIAHASILISYVSLRVFFSLAYH